MLLKGNGGAPLASRATPPRTRGTRVKGPAWWSARRTNGARLSEASRTRATMRLYWESAIEAVTESLAAAGPLSEPLRTSAPWSIIDGEACTRDGRFVEGRRRRQQQAVSWNYLGSTQHHDVSDLDLGDGNVFQRSIQRLAMHCLWDPCQE